MPGGWGAGVPGCRGAGVPGSARGLPGSARGLPGSARSARSARSGGGVLLRRGGGAAFHFTIVRIGGSGIVFVFYQIKLLGS